MSHLPQCWDQKQHDPHRWGYDYPDGPFDCPGLKHGVRFIDKVKYHWRCQAGTEVSCEPYDAGGPRSMEHEVHTEQFGCGWRYVFNLNEEDFKSLGRAFDMGWADIDEMLR